MGSTVTFAVNDRIQASVRASGFVDGAGLCRERIWVKGTILAIREIRRSPELLHYLIQVDDEFCGQYKGLPLGRDRWATADSLNVRELPLLEQIAEAAR